MPVTPIDDPVAMAAEPPTALWQHSYLWVVPEARGFLRSLGLGAEQAEEMAHEFFSTVVIQRRLGERLRDAGSGHLALLRRALRDFHNESLRRRIAEHKRLERLRTRVDRTPPASSSESDRQNALRIIREAVAHTEKHFLECGMPKHWHAFEQRVLLPLMRGTAQPAVKALAREMGLRRGDDLSAMLQLVRRHLVSNLARLGSSLAESERGIVGTLLDALSGARASGE